MSEREVERWITVHGHRVPVYKKGGFTVPAKQREYEDSIRDGNKEQGAFFDKDGNMLMEVKGDADAITFGGEEDWDTTIQFNREVEQRIWDGQEINFTHNHPENTIFSPEDIEGFEELENHSERAVLPNGGAYTIIREQPRTSNEHVYDEKTGEWHRKFEPKKIASAYRAEYEKVYNNEAMDKIRRETEYGSPERAKAIAELDKKVAYVMEKWLKENARKYGYRFVKE